MAGLLDFLFGQGGQGLLGGYGGPAYPNGGAGAVDPSSIPAMGGSQAMAQAAPAPAMGQSPAMQQGAPQQQGFPAIADNPLAAMFPAQANAIYQRQMTQAAMQGLMSKGMSFPQAMITLQNPKVQEAVFGAPTNMGAIKLPNGGEIPSYSIGGKEPTYQIPQNPMIAGQLNTPAKLGETESKVGEISTKSPLLFQNGQTFSPGAALPGAAPSQPGQGLRPPGAVGGLQGAIDLNNKLEQNKVDIKNDSDAYQKDFTGLQSGGRNAIVGAQQAKLLKSITTDPNFYSGPVSDYVKTYRQFQSVLGSDPGKAAPAELFTKVASNMLQEQIKAMGQSGVGRVLQAEVNIMRQSTASMDNTPQGNRALAEILSRTYQHQQAIADIARNIQAPPGQRSAVLNQAVDQYLKENPLFTPDELQHPAVLGAPDAPATAARWSPTQARSWGQSIGLKPGDPVRFNGQLGVIP